MIYRVLLFVLMVLAVGETQGQSTALTNFINCVDSQNGSNNLVINGKPYEGSNLQAKRHPYFQTKEWKPGAVYINGNSYPLNKLKYNLISTQLIVKHTRPNSTTQKIILSDLLIDSFQIQEHLFVNQKLILKGKRNKGFIEKIFADKISFYRLQRKVFTPVYNKSTPNGQFTNQKAIFYLLMNGNQYKITKKKDLLACFPNHKGPIKKYMKEQSMKWKKMTKSQFAQLLKYCNDQI